MSGLVLDPVVIAVLAIAALLYGRAVRVLRRRGRRVTGLQVGAFYAGVAALAVAMLSPLDPLAESDLLLAHMGQHLLIADLAAPLLLVGLRSPVMLFIWPKEILRAVMTRARLRRTLATLTLPYVAVPIWVITLYGWHFEPAFEAALRYPLVHALQHESFFAASMLAWWPLIEPIQPRAPGALWKIGHICGARLAGGFLAMALIFVPRPIYDFYGNGPASHGISAVTDQMIAGGMMMMVDIGIAMGGLAFFFFRAAGDADRQEDPAPTDRPTRDRPAGDRPAADRTAGDRRQASLHPQPRPDPVPPRAAGRAP